MCPFQYPCAEKALCVVSKSEMLACDCLPGGKKKKGGVGGGYECGTLRGEDASGLGEPPGAPSAQQWDQWKSLPLNRGRNTGRGEERKKKVKPNVWQQEGGTKSHPL